MREYITRCCLRLIGLLNKTKSRRLSQELFNLAEEYSTRPGTYAYATPDPPRLEDVEWLEEFRGNALTTCRAFRDQIGLKPPWDHAGWVNCWRMACEVLGEKPVDEPSVFRGRG